MKYPINQYQQLVKHLPTILNYFRLVRDNKPDAKDKEIALGLIHTLYFKIYTQLTYPDNNQNVVFIDGKRLIDLEPFELYPKGINDSHVRTAMIKALKEVFDKQEGSN